MKYASIHLWLDRIFPLRSGRPQGELLVCNEECPFGATASKNQRYKLAQITLTPSTSASKPALRIFFAIALATLIGCHNAAPPLPPTTAAIRQAADSGLSSPTINDILKATVVPPIGWNPEPLKQSPKHRHQVWLSPTGQTAYGIIYFDLPFPVGPDLALWGFLKQMKASEGEANLLFKTPDDKLPGLRFAAEGGIYTVRCNLRVDGFHGWVVYAGTLRSKPINQTELNIAEFAREQTDVDLP